jgi:hypothetical protein
MVVARGDQLMISLRPLLPHLLPAVPAAAAHVFAAAPLPARILKLLLHAQHQQQQGEELLHHLRAECLVPVHPAQILLRLLLHLRLLALQLVSTLCLMLAVPQVVCPPPQQLLLLEMVALLVLPLQLLLLVVLLLAQLQLLLLLLLLLLA